MFISSVFITEESVTMCITHFLCLYHANLKRNLTPLRSMGSLAVQQTAVAKLKAGGGRGWKMLRFLLWSLFGTHTSHFGPDLHSSVVLLHEAISAAAVNCISLVPACATSYRPLNYAGTSSVLWLWLKNWSGLKINILQIFFIGVAKNLDSVHSVAAK